MCPDRGKSVETKLSRLKLNLVESLTTYQFATTPNLARSSITFP